MYQLVLRQVASGSNVDVGQASRADGCDAACFLHGLQVDAWDGSMRASCLEVVWDGAWGKDAPRMHALVAWLTHIPAPLTDNPCPCLPVHVSEAHLN